MDSQETGHDNGRPNSKAVQPNQKNKKTVETVQPSQGVGTVTGVSFPPGFRTVAGAWQEGVGGLGI